MKKQHIYEQKLLEGWEEAYKKGQLTLWILLALKDAPKHMAAIKQFMGHHTNGTLTADDQSMYRALRRYHGAEMVGFVQQPGRNGPDRKVYYLMPCGGGVLAAFLQRNITEVFYTPAIKQLIKERKDYGKEQQTAAQLVSARAANHQELVENISARAAAARYRTT